MEPKINSIKEAFESILCLCAEGVEFLNKVDLAKVIVSEANRGIKVCDELEQIELAYDRLEKKYQTVVRLRDYWIKQYENKKVIPYVSKKENPK